MIILLVLLVISAGLLAAYTGKMQATTLYVGKELGGPGLESIASRGFQDAITPKSQTIRNYLSPVAIILVIVVGFMIKWYVAIFALIAFILVYTVASRLVPQSLGHYYGQIVTAMHVKHADYVKNHDLVRADVAKDMISMLEDYAHRVDLKMSVSELEKKPN